MTSRHSLFLAASATLFAVAPAQTTWVVDADNGVGTHFTDIQPAIDAASTGDIIAIRSGSYTAFSVAKALVIQGQPGATVDATNIFEVLLTVTSIETGETLSIFGLRFDGGTPPTVTTSTISNNSGRVLLDELVFSGNWLGISQSEVWASNCTFAGIGANNATLVLADSNSTATNNSPGLGAFDSSVIASRCTFIGGDAPSTLSLASAGIDSTNSALTLTDTGANIIRSGLVSFASVPAISGTGTLLRDPNVALSAGNGPLVSEQIADTVRQVPSLRATGGSLGGTLTIDIFSRVGDFYELFVGLPQTPVPFPAFGGELALGTIILPVAQGTFAGPTTSTDIQIVNSSALIGLPLAWQAVAGVLSNQLYLSNPDFGVLHP